MAELKRFITAQEKSFAQALSEIKAGRKQTHWMWYIFPQLRGLGHSDMAVYYGIANMAEAKAYMAQPYLRENLLTVTGALLALEQSDPCIVMGGTDSRKLCSSMTLFALAAPEISEFSQVLDKFFGGVWDKRTMQMLSL